jgi:hypothetical protein
MAELKTDVRYIKGIGEQRAKALNKLGIATLQDLISWFPRRYDDRREAKRIADLVPDEYACVSAMVAAEPKINRIRKGMELVKVRAVDDSGTLDVTFFNQTWLKDHLKPGETYVFYGKAEGNLLRHGCVPNPDQTGKQQCKQRDHNHSGHDAASPVGAEHMKEPLPAVLFSLAVSPVHGIVESSKGCAGGGNGETSQQPEQTEENAVRDPAHGDHQGVVGV